MLFKQPSEEGLAQLLSLSTEEFKNLKHAPLIEDKNNLGEITGYFMHISPDNDKALLLKIFLGKSNFVWFSVNQINSITKGKT